MGEATFPKHRHLRRPAEFDRVYAHRCTARNNQVLVFAALSDVGPRIGLSVGRKHGGAVVRNRIRRLLREAFRQTQSDWPIDCDFVLVPQDAKELTVAELLANLPQLARDAARRARKKGPVEIPAVKPPRKRGKSR
ncbi:MAG TPA: ribonuclease P protein component [Planctomycetaceae bacterium]|nr:ribonuclease P protein component [Planctomycetaceae bacterium]